MAPTTPHHTPALKRHSGSLTGSVKRIGVGSVVGDELFLAVVFLGTAGSLPAVVDINDDDDDDDDGDGDDDGITGEFVLVLAFPSAMR